MRDSVRYIVIRKKIYVHVPIGIQHVTIRRRNINAQGVGRTQSAFKFETKRRLTVTKMQRRTQ